MLNNITVSEALAIHTLIVADLSDITSLICNNRILGYLELGNIQVEGSKGNEHTQGTTVVASIDQFAREETIAKPPKLKHLVLYPGDLHLPEAPMPAWLATISTSHQEERLVSKGCGYLGLRPVSPPNTGRRLMPLTRNIKTIYEETNTVYTLIETVSDTLHSLILRMHPRMSLPPPVFNPISMMSREVKTN